MKTLQPKMRKNGFDYNLVYRGKKSCIYEQKVTENLSYYEVFSIKIKPESKINGKIVEAREWFPHNEAFGKWAWTYKSFGRAVYKLNQLEYPNYIL